MVVLLAAATVSFVFLSVVVFALISFIAKHRSLAVLKLLPGPKPSIFFGNALWLTGESEGKYFMYTTLRLQLQGRIRFNLFYTKSAK